MLPSNSSHERQAHQDAWDGVLKANTIQHRLGGHRGYSARVEFDDEDGLFVGHIAGINDIIGFQGEIVSELRSAFQDAVDDYTATCAKAGRAPEKPYSGKVMFRINPRTHARLALAAQLRGISLNPLAEEALLQRADQELVST